MGAAHFDDNHVATLTGILNTNGTTITNVKANSSTHGVLVNDGSTGTDNGPSQAMFDDNHVPTAIAVSSSDGVTPVPLYVDSSGALLVKST